MNKKQNKRLLFLLKKHGGVLPASSGAQKTLLEQLEIEDAEDRASSAAAADFSAVAETDKLFQCVNSNCYAMNDTPNSYCSKCKDLRTKGVKLVHRSEPVYKMKKCKCSAWFAPAHARQSLCTKCAEQKQEQKRSTAGMRFMWSPTLIQEGRKIVEEMINNQPNITKSHVRFVLSDHFKHDVSWCTLPKFTNGLIADLKPKQEKKDVVSPVVQQPAPFEVFLDVVKSMSIEQLMSLQAAIDLRKVEVVDEATRAIQNMEAQLKAVKSFIDRK